ncbi:MAG: hypothetical protein VX436_02915 [Planctomycetota bacterium]|nr:hypothetical protein [Planctomycetota bacterium]
MTIKHLAGSHQVLVIGDERDATDIRARDIPVLGSIDGPLNASRTLDRRVKTIVDKAAKLNMSMRIFAWGWHGAAVASSFGNNYKSVAIVDDIDRSCFINSGRMTIIPTSYAGVESLNSIGISSSSIAEPLVGVIPTGVLVDQITVRELLDLERAEMVIALLGKQMSWQEVIRMAARFKSAAKHIDLVIPRGYLNHAKLIEVAKRQGLSAMLHNPPAGLRQIDIINGVDAVWAPLVAQFDESCEVLQIIQTAAAGVPMAVSELHHVSTVPDVGSLIATEKSHIDICGWILSLQENATAKQEDVKVLKSHIAKIASPSMFIDGLRQRWPSGF